MLTSEDGLPLPYYIELLFLPVIFGLLVIYAIALYRIEKLHINCKTLLFTWLLGFFVMVTTHICLIMWRIATGIFVPPDRLIPYEQIYFLCAHEFGYAMSSCSELLIVFERIIASIRLDKYKVEKRVVVVAIILMSIASCSFVYIYHINRHVIPALIFANSFDIAVLVLNRFIHLYSRRLHKRQIELSRLDAKYLISEVYRITSAILPVTIVSVTFKLAAFAATYGFLFFKLQFYIAVTTYYAMHTINCGLCTILFMIRYDTLREKVRELFFCFSAPVRNEKPAESYLSADEQAAKYFAELKASWQ